MPNESEIEVVRCVIRDEIRRFWDETDPAKAEGMIDGYRQMARLALEAAERVRGTNDRERILAAALEASVGLQSHYAKLLNDYDGGRRLAFADAQAWLERLAVVARKESQSESRV